MPSLVGRLLQKKQACGTNKVETKNGKSYGATIQESRCNSPI